MRWEDEVNGKTKAELADLKNEYQKTDNYKRLDLDFDEFYCLTRIGHQPDWYDGPTRYCSRNSATRYEDSKKPRHPSCVIHGGRTGGNVEDLEGYLGDPTLVVTHGMYAKDETLREDLEPREEEIVDKTLEWAEAYGWPPEDEDPARYNILERLALNFVRENRALQEVIAEGEIEVDTVMTGDGELVDMEQPHKLAEPLRLLQKQIHDEMDDLGLTPKAQSKMDAEQSEASAAEMVSEVAKEAVDSEKDYDPSEFSE